MNRIVLLIVLLLTCAFSGFTQEVNRGKEFGIYLVAGSWDRRLMQGKGEWTNLTLLSEPIISEQEMVSYEWETHRLTLKFDQPLQMLRRVPVAGLPFVVVAGGERIYFGAFVTSASSMSVAVPSIRSHPQSNSVAAIDRAYPTAAFGVGADPRSDARIKAALARAGILDKKVDLQALAVMQFEGAGYTDLTVTTNDVIRVEKPGVGVSVIQFVEFTPNAAKARWRFKPLHGPITSGSGEVNPGKASIHAGEIYIAWSEAGLDKGYAYYCPSREKAEVLPGTAFNDSF